ncbi:hypothetical protein [Actinopolymorpha rutila]|uniref:SPW repeat-containing protein n=1 Tax=Actinopolymorpha rutila TaxID=446787 RepID=A0A852ZH11_9ACTN|nr:hypothetical protein [Actinopolymorpha rutila]NYH92441.1 hypothetical protein [Actinopolymorpha rutila]
MYYKMITAFVGCVATWAVAALQDGAVSPNDWGGLVIALGTAVTVYVVPNVRGSVGAYAKTFAAVLGAAGTWVSSALPAGVTGQEWAALVLAVVTGLGVLAVPGPVSDHT